MSQLVNGQTMEHLHSGQLLSNKKEQTTAAHSYWVDLKCTVLSERNKTQKTTYIGCFHLYDSSAKAKLQEQKTVHWMSGAGSGGRVDYSEYGGVF